MAKKPNTNRTDRPASATDRQAKIQAAQKATGTGGANKITIAGVVVILAIIAVVGGVIWSQKSAEDAVGSGNTSPPAGATVAEGYRSFADVTLKPGAPTVTVFEDFQCPACRDLEAILGTTIADLAESGDIKLNYHVMNFLDDATGAKQSTPVANGAFCAADQGKWQAFHDAAFSGQYTEGTSVTQEQVAAFAKTAGVPDLSAWEACTSAGKYTAYINDSNESAGKLGVTGTPTIRINDQMYSGQTLAPLGTPEGFTKAVQDATK